MSTRQTRSGPSPAGGGGTAFVFVGTIALVTGLLIHSQINSSDNAPNKHVKAQSKTTHSTIGKAILKAALKHDYEPYVYGGGHPLKSYRKGSGVDCSSLVNVAVYEATGVKEDNLARDFRKSRHWYPIKAREARAGDIMYLLREKHPGHDDDHVVFVVSNRGKGKLTIFEAYSSRRAVQPYQIRISYRHKYSDFDGALRFKR